MSHSDSSPSSTFYLLSLLGVVVVSYVLGTAITVFRPPPFEHVLTPMLAPLRTIFPRDQLPKREPGTPEGWHVPRRTDSFGVTTHHDSGDRGLTFYTSGHGSIARLIDARGSSLQKWELSADEIWETGSPDDEGDETSHGYWRDAHLYPNGDLVTIVAHRDDDRRAFGVLRLDQQSEPVWAHTDRVHHDLDVDSEGDIWVLARRIRSKKSNPVPDLPGMPPKFWEDTILQIDDRGEPKAEISLIDALDQSSFRKLLQSAPQFDDGPGEDLSDPLHAASIDVVDDEFARQRDFAKPGDLVVSLRSLDAVVVVRPSDRRVVWATRGVWWHPSDVDALPSGNLLVFDQDGHGGPGLPSRAVRYEPPRGSVPWTWGGNEQTRVWSQKGGSVQALSDGRTLLSSNMMGSIVEIDRSGEILWAYRNPVRVRRQNRTLAATLWSVRRLRRSELDFQFDADSDR